MRQEVTHLLIDGEAFDLDVACDNSTRVRVDREAEIIFAGGASSSDATWLVFVSEPITFVCGSWFMLERGEPPTPGALGPWQRMPRFRLEATAPLDFGVVRAALVNNCTSGTSPVACETVGVAADREAYGELLREHASVYPTGEARVAYSSSDLSWIEHALEVRVGCDTIWKTPLKTRCANAFKT